MDSFSISSPDPQKELTSSNGLLSSRYWPSPYRKKIGYYHTETCQWKINPQRTNMMIVIMDVDLAVDRDSSPSSRRRDVLKFEYLSK